MVKLKNFFILHHQIFKVLIYCYYYYFELFFVLSKIISNWETYFMNYELQTNEKMKMKKKHFYHPLYLSLWLLKTSFFCLLPQPTPIPPSWIRIRYQVKCQIVLVFQTFSSRCHFLLHIVCCFLMFTEIFSSVLTFMISLIKDFNINDLNPPRILNIYSKY